MAGAALLSPPQRKVTFRQLAKLCCWARNNHLTVSGKTGLELAFGRRPPDLLDVETANPEQLTLEPLPQDKLDVELKPLAMKAHLEARQLQDQKRDLVQHVQP